MHPDLGRRLAADLWVSQGRTNYSRLCHLNFRALQSTRRDPGLHPVDLLNKPATDVRFGFVIIAPGLTQMFKCPGSNKPPHVSKCFLPRPEFKWDIHYILFEFATDDFMSSDLYSRDRREGSQVIDGDFVER